MHKKLHNIMLSKGQKVTLLIEKLLYGGGGLSHLGNMACFIDDVIPGETVSATIDTVKKQYATALLSTICEPSPHRTNPPCPYFKRCGGCQWQHIDYSMQLHWKWMIVRECIERIGGLRDVAVREPIPSPALFQYRSRTNIKVNTASQPVIGYFQRGTHSIIPVTHCPLLVPPINQSLEFCITLLADNRDIFRGITEIHFLRISTNDEVLITFCQGSAIKSCLLFFSNESSGTTSIPLPLQSALEYSYYDDILGVSFIRRPLTFYQINVPQNAAMINTVLSYLEPHDGQNILDLYCGCGNFSLFLARQGLDIVGIDSSSNAIEEAIKNTELNHLDNCTYICGDVEITLPQFISTNFHSVLINPPRRGCTPKTLRCISQISPRVIIYISCNPSTLARDLKQLMGSGYHIDVIQPVDMFPQTYHIETIVKMIKS
jgi:23S rRNA (uracil1939-C5)-methyltransferase